MQNDTVVLEGTDSRGGGNKTHQYVSRKVLYLQGGFLRALGSRDVDDQGDPYTAIEEGRLGCHSTTHRETTHHGRRLACDVWTFRGFKGVQKKFRISSEN